METITNARGAASQWCKKGMLTFILLLTVVAARSATYYSAGNNAPNVLANWWSATNGTGSHPASFNNTNVYVIQNGHTMTTSAAWTITNNSTIQINTEGKLRATFEVLTPNMNVGSGGTYEHAQNGGTIPFATWHANSTCIVSGYTIIGVNPPSYSTSFAQSFGNFTWNCTGQTGAISLGGVLTSVAGNFTMASTGGGSFSFGISGVGNSNIGGNYIQTGGNIYMSGYNLPAACASRSINITGNFSLTGGTCDISSSSAAASVATVNVGGNFTHTAGTLTETGSTTGSIIRFSSSATPHVYTSGGTITNLVNFSVDAGATLNMGTAASPSTISGSTGAFTLQSGGTLGVTSPAGISAVGTNTGNIRTTGSRSYSAGNIVYMGNSAQATGNGLTAASNVSITNTSGVTFTSQAAVTGNISLVTGATAVLGAGYVHTAASLTLGGVAQAVNTSYGSTASAASNKNLTFFGATTNGIISLGSCVAGTWTGIVSTDWHTAGNWCSNSVPTSASNIVITAGTNQPLISSAAVCNNITINAGATVTLDATNALTVSGTFVNNGSFTTNAGTLTVAGTFTNGGSYYGNTGTLVINNSTASAFTNNGTFTPNSGTVNFNGGAQTVITPAQTPFYNVIIGGTGLKTINATNFVVMGTLSMEATGTISAQPTYGVQATLQYNKPAAFTSGVEWPPSLTISGGAVIKNTGVITLSANKVFTSCPLTIMDGATLGMSARTLSGPSALNLYCGGATAGSAITGTGLLTLGGNVSVTDAGAGTAGASISCPVSLNSASYDISVADDGSSAPDLTFSGIVSTTASPTKLGAGTLFMTNTANTYSGTTTITEGEYRVNPSATAATATTQINFNGGNLTSTNIAATTTLTNSKTVILSENSSITLGSNVHSLKFANSSAFPWTASKYLFINGWAGNYTNSTSGTAGKLYVGTTNAGLTASQLAEIKFYDGASYYNATQLATGEVVPSGPISSNFVSVQTGDWDDPATWGYTGAAVAGFTIPGTADNATIASNHVVTLTSNTATSGTLTFTAAGTLNMDTYSMTVGALTANNISGTATIAHSTSGSITVNGALTTTSGGTLNMNANQLLGTLTTITNGGTIQTQNTSATPIPTGKTWSGTVEYNAATGGQTIVSGTYSNLSMSNTSGTQTAAGALTVNGSFTTTAGGTLNLVTYQLLGALTSVSNSGIMQTQNTSASPIPTGKTWGGTVMYNATTGGQTITPATYNNLTLSNTSGTQTAGGDLTVNSSFITTAGGTCDMEVHQLLGTLTPTNNGVLKTQNTGATPLPSGKTWGATVQYNASTGGQTVVDGTYTTLIMSNTSGTQTANGDITVNTGLTTTAGGTLSMSSHQLLGAFTPTNNGTIETQNTSATPIPNGKTWAGTVRYNSLSGSQTARTGTYNSLVFDNTSGTQTADGAIIAASLTTTTGGICNMSTFALSGLSSVTNDGTLRTQNTSATPFTAGLTWGGTLVFDGASAQTIPSTSSIFTNLTINNAAGVTAAADQTVLGELNLASANPNPTTGSLDMGTHTLNFKENSTTTGVGDVTGIMHRAHTFATNVEYTFGNKNQSIKFPVVAGQVLPTTFTVKVSLTAVSPTWKAGAIKREYDVAQTGGSGTNAFYRSNYNNSEIVAGSENQLTFWSSNNHTTGMEMGRANQDVADNWITLANVNISHLPATLGNIWFTLAPSLATTVTWDGSFDTNWDESSNWTPALVPDPTHLIIIPIITASNNRSPILPADALGNKIIIESGGVVNAANGATLNLSGVGDAWNVNPGGTFNAGSNSTITFSGFSASGIVTIIGETDFNNIVISAGTLVRPGTNSHTGITGSLTINGILSAVSTENTIEFMQNGDYTIPNLNPNPNPTGALPGYHNLVISGTGTKTLPATLDIYGDFTNNGAVNANSGLVSMKALDGELHDIGGLSTTAFYDLTIANSGVEPEITTSANITVSNTFTINSGATITPGAAYTIGGTGTMTGLGTAKVTRTLATPDFNSQYTIANKTISGLSVDYAGAGNQEVNPHDYKDLIISANGTRTVTMQNTGTIGITGTFNPDMTTTSYIVTGSTLEAKGSGSQYVPAFNFYHVKISGDRAGGTITLVNGGTIGIAGHGSVTATNANYDLTNNTIDINGGNQIVDGFTFNNVIFSNSGTKTAVGDLDVYNSITVTPGVTLDMNNYRLKGTMTSVANAGTIRTSMPTAASAFPIPADKIWGGTVEYYATTPQMVLAGTYENLNINCIGTGCGTTSGNITVNGALTLAANTTTTRGILETGSNILYMGESSTTVGAGDVTGIVERIHLFGNGVEYSFGNQFTTINFLNTGIKPTWVRCKITLGAAPGWHTAGITRIYSFAQLDGTDRVIAKLHYLDNEMHDTEKDESKLVFWDGYDPAGGQYNFVKYYPRNKNDYNATDNWVKLIGPAINYLATSTVLDVKQWGLSYTNVTTHTWTGNGSPSYDGDWSLPGNWNGGVPTSADNVFIPVPSSLPADNNGDLAPYRNLLSAFLPACSAKKLEIEAGVTMSMLDGSPFQISGSTDAWVNNGLFNAGSSSVTFNHGISLQPVDLKGTGVSNFHDLIVSANTMIRPGTSSTNTISGDLTAGAGSVLDFAVNPNTIKYTGANQTILGANGSPAGYYNLELSGSGTKTMPVAPLSIAGDMAITGTASVTAGDILTVGQSFSLQSGAEFNAGNYTHTVGENWVNNGTFTAGGSTLEFNGASAGDIGASNFNNVSFTGAGVKTASGALSVQGDVVISGNFNAGASTHTVGGDWTNSGTFTPDASTINFDGVAAADISASSFNNVTFSGAGTKTATGALAVLGDITISKNVSLGDFHHQVAGDFINTGTFTSPCGTGSITFNGSGEQNIRSGSSNFGDVVFNNSNVGTNDFNIAEPMTISCSANFVDGISNFSETGSLTLENGSVVTGGSTNSFVDGPLTKYGNTAFNFPVGDNGQYAPISISAADGGGLVTDAFTATYFNYNPNNDGFDTGLIGTGLHHISTSEYWTLDRTGTTNNVNVQLSWDARSGGVTNLATMAVAHWNGSQWEDKGSDATTGNTSAGTITSELFTSFSPVALASTTSSNPLPITLIDFRATSLCESNKVKLIWKCASEYNNDYFSVERSRDGISWYSLALIKSKGNTVTGSEYEIFDATNSAGNGYKYYRLIPFDVDGDSGDAKTVSVSSCADASLIDIIVQPNPFAENISVFYTAVTQSQCLVEIVDVNGQILYSRTYAVTTGTNEFSIILGTLPQGMYFLRCNNGTGMSMKMIVKE